MLQTIRDNFAVNTELYHYLDTRFTAEEENILRLRHQMTTHIQVEIKCLDPRPSATPTRLAQLGVNARDQVQDSCVVPMIIQYFSLSFSNEHTRSPCWAKPRGAT